MPDTHAILLERKSCATTPTPARTAWPRVLFVDQSGELGGAELMLADVVAHYPGESRVLTFQDGPFPDRLRALDIDVVLPSKAARFQRGDGIRAALSALPALAAITATVARHAKACDVLVANTQKALIVCAAIAAATRKPLLFFQHDILNSPEYSALARRAAAFASRAIRQTIANSNAAADGFAAIGARCPIAIVPNAFDVRQFNVITKREARERLPTPPNAKLVGIFGRLAAWKGQHIAIDAIADTPDAHLLIVGSALFGEHVYEAGLIALARKRGVGDRVHFLGMSDDVPTLMSACDIIVHASTSPEPFGRVVVEGMLSRRPVIASAAGGVLEIISGDETGVLVPPGNAPALANAIRALLDDPGRADRIANAARASAEARYALAPTLATIHARIAACADAAP